MRNQDLWPYRNVDGPNLNAWVFRSLTPWVCGNWPSHVERPPASTFESRALEQDAAA